MNNSISINPELSKVINPLITYTVEEVADRLRCTSHHLYKLISDGRIKTANPADKKADWKISQKALADFIESTIRA